MLTRQERAKQFLPFSALKGFEEYLKKQEFIKEEKKELSEESLQELSDTMLQIDINSYIFIKYYSFGTYKDIKGTVKKIDSIKKRLTINDINIYFRDIIEIKI